MSAFCIIDDKYILLYRVLWVSGLPHFCGESDCEQEGNYEVRLEQGESVWANRQQRDDLLDALEKWCGDIDPEEDDLED